MLAGKALRDKIMKEYKAPKQQFDMAGKRLANKIRQEAAVAARKDELKEDKPDG